MTKGRGGLRRKTAQGLAQTVYRGFSLIFLSPPLVGRACAPHSLGGRVEMRVYVPRRGRVISVPCHCILHLGAEPGALISGKSGRKGRHARSVMLRVDEQTGCTYNAEKSHRPPSGPDSQELCGFLGGPHHQGKVRKPRKSDGIFYVLFLSARPLPALRDSKKPLRRQGRVPHDPAASRLQRLAPPSCPGHSRPGNSCPPAQPSRC